VFDGTASERATAEKTLSNITVCEVERREFTSELKDYNDYRLKHDVNDFLVNIIKMGFL
jgi:hypothetical protein